MNGLELDRRMREILLGATRENSLSSVRSMMELGFGPALAAKMIIDVITARERQDLTR